MKKIKWWLETGFAGASYHGEFEVDDDTSADEIEEMAQDIAFSQIDWGYDEEDV